MNVDVVDDDNVPVGVTDREQVLDEGRNFRTAHGIFQDASGKFALQRLMSSHPRSPGKLGSTVAGYLYSGESYDGAIARISKAEIGIVPPNLVALPILPMMDKSSKKFVKIYFGFAGSGMFLKDSQTSHMEFYNWSRLLDMAEKTPEDLTATLLFLLKEHAGVGLDPHIA